MVLYHVTPQPYLRWHLPRQQTNSANHICIIYVCHICMFAYGRFDSVFAFTALFYRLLLPYGTYELLF
jgi:hypothetical protein